MPIRTFTCAECGEKFERILFRKDYDETIAAICPECNGVASADAVPLVARRNPEHGLQK